MIFFFVFRILKNTIKWSLRFSLYVLTSADQDKVSWIIANLDFFFNVNVTVYIFIAIRLWIAKGGRKSKFMSKEVSSSNYKVT